MIIMGLSEGCLKREKAKYFRRFWGLPEKKVGITFLEGRRPIAIPCIY